MASRPDLDTLDSGEGAEPPRAPRHVGIIMDGNGRWAAARGLPRIEGHRRGMEAVREAVRAAPDFRIGYLTLYSFSSENWARPAEEVEFLFSLLRLFIDSELPDLHRNGVRITVIGARAGIPPDIAAKLAQAEALTAGNRGLRLQVAFNYGGRDEIARAVRKIAAEVAVGRLPPEAVTPELIADHLDTAGMPYPDLIIRTGGELRLSNFLLWQAAYAELVFLPVFWPEFDRRAFAAALEDYRRRTRRYGGLAASARA